MEKLIITAAITGADTDKNLTPHIPLTPAEIADDVVRVVKAGAAIVHIHVRDDEGFGSMDTDRFIEAYKLSKAALEKNGLDAILNLTTSGAKEGTCADELRLAHLKVLRPEMCSFDAGTINFGCDFVFDNSPAFLEKLCNTTLECEIKPEIEIFDAGMMGNAKYYMDKGLLKAPCHFQFVLGVLGGLEGTVENLQFLVNRLPAGSTWSVTGIGKAHMPMMLAGLAMGCNGIRVGLEDNIYYSHGVKATNAQLVERAVTLAKLSGREIASAEEARQILGIRR